MIKTVCPPDCPDRHAGCGATCETFQRHWKEKQARYARKDQQRRINELTDKSVRESLRKINKKQSAF